MTASEYDLDFFRTKGFARRTCPKCGRHFWSLGTWETCGEPPCEEYTFIGNSPMKESLGLHEMREAYLSFFEDRGHTRVARYPIVARWRDDVFFTQASIYDFQPWVIDGVVDPPANPLVISQTCVRFNDIDNVGKTGRHHTFFEMLAHHAFNRKGREVYFKERTVELCHEFFTGRLGTPPERMRYVEEWWEGGGNSGPCLEVILDGAELATLVFMMYRDLPEGRRPLSMTVVDTGYGLERIAWVSQGASSTYEAVFGPVVTYLKDVVGASAESAMLNEYSKIAGMTNAKTAADVRKIREMTASRIGISYEELMKDLRPLEDIYVVCDHSRALAFLINDGVVPSNVREGYFARLLVRRGLRAMRSLGIDVTLSDVVGRQIDFFSPIFPEMRENREDILSLVEVEEGRYRETLARGKSLVSRISKDLKPGEKISTEKLIELYDSHGLNPEIVKEFTTIEVDIPDDFYIQVSARHEKPERDEVKGESIPDNLPETKMLFYDDPRKLDFEATVLAAIGGGVVLDQTAFYPEGGGQESDTGSLGGKRVTKALRIGNAVIHLLDGALPKEGSRVKGSVDRERRLQLMRHHTAAHLINGISRKILGNHVWQAGAHKSEAEGRLDITHHEGLTAEQKNAIEREVNRVVLEDIPVRVQFMPRIEAERLHGFRLYQGGAVPGGTIRVVEVPSLDAEACGGLHCERTSQVGLVRIPRTKRIQDGVVRIEFLVGMPAVDSTMRESGELDRLAAELGVPLQDAVARAIEYRDLSRKQGRELRRVSDILHLSDSAVVIKDAEKIDGISLVVREAKEGEEPMPMLRALTANPKVVAVITAVEGTGLKVLVARSSDVEIDCRAVLKEVMKITGGGGGGKKEFAQGGGGDPTKLPEAIGMIPKIIRRLAKDEIGR